MNDFLVVVQVYLVCVQIHLIGLLRDFQGFDVVGNRKFLRGVFIHRRRRLARWRSTNWLIDVCEDLLKFHTTVLIQITFRVANQIESWILWFNSLFQRFQFLLRFRCRHWLMMPLFLRLIQHLKIIFWKFTQLWLSIATHLRRFQYFDIVQLCIH